MHREGGGHKSRVRTCGATRSDIGAAHARKGSPARKESRRLHIVPLESYFFAAIDSTFILLLYPPPEYTLLLARSRSATLGCGKSPQAGRRPECSWRLGVLRRLSPSRSNSWSQKSCGSVERSTRRPRKTS